MLPAVLSMTAGAVDVIGFLALGGLFTAHISGNRCVVSAHYITGGFSKVGPLLSVPVFIAVLGVVALAFGRVEKASDGSQRALLVQHAPLLAACLGLGVGFGPFAEQAFERVGGNETIRTDARLIASTHRDLQAWSAEGKFRPDLYYRLGVFTIHLPPLRERGDDMKLLVQHYLRRYNRELGREIREMAPEALERLQSYAWPGNIRELQSVLKQALLGASGMVLLQSFLPLPPETGPASPCPRHRRPAKSLERRRSSFTSGWGPTPWMYTRTHTANWTGCCCPASWGTPAGASSRPPSRLESPGKPCA